MITESSGSTGVKKAYTGNGVTTTWPITFPYGEVSDIHLYLEVDGGEAEEITTNFEVDEDALTVTYPVDGDPLEDDSVLTLICETPISQDVDLINGGPYDAEVIEAEFDKLTQISQQMREELDRAIKFPVSTDPTDEQTSSVSYLAEIEAFAVAAASSAAGAAASAAAAVVSAAAVLASEIAAAASAAAAVVSAAAAAASAVAAAASAATATTQAGNSATSAAAAAASAAAAVVSAAAALASQVAAAASAVAAAASAATATTQATNAAASAAAASASQIAAASSASAASASQIAAAASAATAAAAAISVTKLPADIAVLKAAAVVGFPFIALANDLGQVVFYTGVAVGGSLGDGFEAI